MVDVTIKLLVVSINWMNSNFYVLLEDGKIPEEKAKLSETNQPVNVAKDMSEELVTLSQYWMNYHLVETYMKDEDLNIVYKVVVPHDPNLSLNAGCEWKNIKLFNSEDQHLKESIEKAIRGIT